MPASRPIQLMFGCIALGLGHPSLAQQAYPAKPLRFIVPFPPGGSIDPVARMLAPRLADSLGQQVIVDNRPGANGAIGSDMLAKSPPDGHTLILLGGATHVVNALLVRNLPYDSIKDFAPVATVQRSDYVLVVHPSLPLSTLKQLIALAKANPGQLSYASAGNGNLNHLAAEMFNLATGVKSIHVPYKGGGQALTDVMGGQVHMHFAVVVSALGHIKANRLKPLAIGGDQRFPALPDVPTFTEAGLPGFRLQPWQGVFVQGRTPKPIIDRLGAEISRIVALPEITGRITGWGSQPMLSTPEQVVALVSSDFNKFAQVIKGANIKLD